MSSGITLFEPQPPLAEVPAVLADPFELPPPALAQRAAREVMVWLEGPQLAPGVPTSILEGERGGKMFGVLVVATADQRVGYLKAFSGQLLRRWELPGFVPPAFDRQERARVELPGEARVKEWTAKVAALREDPRWAQLDEERRLLEGQQRAARTALRSLHAANREARQRERERLQAQGCVASEPYALLARQSQADDEQLRVELRPWREKLAAVEARRSALREELSRVEAAHLDLSREVSWQLYDTYRFESVGGEVRTLRALFAPNIPSSGTGDCAAPKLLIHALRTGLRPLVFAEFWWGAPPPGGGRRSGTYVAPCAEKCRPLLSFILGDGAVARGES